MLFFKNSYIVSDGDIKLMSEIVWSCSSGVPIHFTMVNFDPSFSLIHSLFFSLSLPPSFFLSFSFSLVSHARSRVVIGTSDLVARASLFADVVFGGKWDFTRAVAGAHAPPPPGSGCAKFAVLSLPFVES